MGASDVDRTTRFPSEVDVGLASGNGIDKGRRRNKRTTPVCGRSYQPESIKLARWRARETLSKASISVWLRRQGSRHTDALASPIGNAMSDEKMQKCQHLTAAGLGFGRLEDMPEHERHASYYFCFLWNGPLANCRGDPLWQESGHALRRARADSAERR